MKAEILSIGTELLRGEITDTNASFLASQMPSLGLELNWITQVDDSQPRIVEALRRAWARSDLILVTGGLGPTVDDLTRESVAELLGEEPKVDPFLERELREFFARRHYEMPLNNLKQATLIPSARSLPNPYGTAPGWLVEKEGRTIAVMPGPPSEMQSMWRNEVLPALRLKFSREYILTRTLKTFGLGESRVDELVAPLFQSSNPSLGVYSKPDGVHITITARAGDEAGARGILATSESDVLSRLGERVWGVDEDTLETAVARALASRRLSLAAAEYGTGGLFAAALSAVAEASAWFKGGLVAGDGEACVGSGLEPDIYSRFGPVSPEAVECMAGAVRARFQAGVGIAVAVGGKTPGLVCVAVSTGEKTGEFKAEYPGNAAQVRRRAVAAALFQLRQTLCGAVP